MELWNLAQRRPKFIGKLNLVLLENIQFNQFFRKLHKM